MSQRVPRCAIEQLDAATGQLIRPRFSWRCACSVRPHLKHSNIGGLGSVSLEMNYVDLAVRMHGLPRSVDIAPRDSAYDNYIEL
jgi:hypothetical protein